MGEIKFVNNQNARGMLSSTVGTQELNDEFHGTGKLCHIGNDDSLAVLQNASSKRAARNVEPPERIFAEIDEKAP